MSTQPADPVDASPYAALAELFGLDAKRHAWRAYAACKARPDLSWFPGRGESLAEQRAVCNACPVQQPCLAAALNNSEHDGIWGGTSERDRRRIRRQRNADNGTSPVAADVINHLAEIGGTFHGGGAALAAAIGRSDCHVATVVGDLEDAGHITVDPPSPRLARQRINTITLNRSATP